MLTYEDYLLFPEDGHRHELIDGEHIVTPSPSRRHQVVSWRLSRWIGNFLEDNPIGEALAAPFDVVLTREDVVQPDLMFVSSDRSGIWADKNVQGAPDLVIEILSEGTRDRDETRKLNLYERFGVREYWLVDPVPETAQLYRREGGRLVLVQEISAAQGDFLETPLLPGLRIPLVEVFD
jgi:Uma2 family endonuclease